MSTTDRYVRTITGEGGFTKPMSRRAEPSVRPGPWTDDGLTATTSMSRSAPSANTRCSATNLDRSYADRNVPRCGVSSAPTTPRASPIVAADDVYTTRATPARAAAVITDSDPWTFVRNMASGSRMHIAFTPATWNTVPQ